MFAGKPLENGQLEGNKKHDMVTKKANVPKDKEKGQGATRGRGAPEPASHIFTW